jgi:hypothetical protein
MQDIEVKLGFSRTYGVVMITSASGMCWSNVEFSPSLSDVVTSSWPWSSSHLRIPSSFSVVPRSSGCSFACSNPCVVCVSESCFERIPSFEKLEMEDGSTYIVQDHQDLALTLSSRAECSRRKRRRTSSAGEEGGGGAGQPLRRT